MMLFSVLIGASVHAGISPYGLGRLSYTDLSLAQFVGPTLGLGLGAFLLAWGFTRSFQTTVRFYGADRSGARVELVQRSWLIGGLTTIFFGFGLTWMGVLISLPFFYFSHEGPVEPPGQIAGSANTLSWVGIIILAIGLGVVGAVEFRRRREAARLKGA
jgi:membrane protease YdiL (CAAX protease family)